MIIHLKKNEKLFINGAVIRLDRRGSVELMNDAQFLIASHVMQVESATTPLRQLYFVIQTMLIDPANAELTRCVFAHNAEQTRLASVRRDYRSVVEQAEKKVSEAKYFDALKLLRTNFELDDEVLASRSITRVMSESEAA
jgi:flagellar protein FlbT